MGAEYNGYVYKSGNVKRCLTEKQCLARDGHYAYVDDSGAERRCISRDDCAARSGHVHGKKCLTEEQCTSSGLTVDADARTCDKKEARCDYLYGSKCVTRDECVFGELGLVYESGAEKLCLTGIFACADKGGYVSAADESMCLTRDQCADGGNTPDGERHICEGGTVCLNYVRLDGSCLTEEACKGLSDGYVYISGRVKRCMTREECTADGRYYVDEAERMCVSEATCKTSKYVLSEKSECVDADGCGATGEYEISEADRSCVRKNVCTGYLLANGTCATVEECGNTYSGYTLEESGSRRCLTREECRQKDYYFDEAGRKCVSEDECQGYLFLAYGKEECVDAETCVSERSGLLFDGEPNKLCLTRDQCAKINMFVYNDYCVSSSSCGELGYAANFTIHACEAATEVACASDKYVLAGKQCVDASTCISIDGRLTYTYDDGTERLCLTSASKCAEREGYVFNRECLTESQCRGKTM